MIPAGDLVLFAAAALIMVLTPGPNMIYLVSRSICQGRAAGVMSLFGVIAGFVVHMLAAAIGLSALFLAVPLAYEALNGPVRFISAGSPGRRSSRGRARRSSRNPCRPTRRVSFS